MTYKAEGENEQGGDGVGQHAQAEDVDVLHGDEQVPQEVSAGKCLDQTASTGVAMHLGQPVHLAPLVIVPHDPQGKHADESALDEGHDVHIPVELCAGIEAGVYAGEEEAREDWRDEDVDGVVENEGEEDFVDVQREGVEGEIVGDGFGALA